MHRLSVTNISIDQPAVKNGTPIEKVSSFFNIKSFPTIQRTDTGSGITLENVLETSDGISIFMSHCMHELSMENLLAVIELTQYQMWIKFMVQSVWRDELAELEIKENDEKELEDNNPGKMFPNMVRLHFEKLPKSSIVFDDVCALNSDDKSARESLTHEDKYNTIMDRIRKLHVKYIECGGELTLTLSDVMRKIVTRDVKRFDSVGLSAITDGEVTYHDMYHIFDGVIYSTMRLMGDTFSRFRETKKYSEYKEHFLSANQF